LVDILPATGPRPSLQVTMAAGVVEQLPLVQPRGMGRRQPGTPPAPAALEIAGRLAGGVAAAPIVDEEDPTETAVPSSERIQSPDVMLGVVGIEDDRLHPAGMDDQKRQDVDRAVPGV